MENPGTLPLAVALAVFALLETVLFALRRFAPRFPIRPLDHLWAVLVAAWAGLSLLGLGPGRPLWRVVAAAALVLTVLVAFSALERLVLLRPWDAARGPMAPKLARDVLRVLLLAGGALVAATAIFDVNLSTVLVSSTVVSAVLGLALQDVLKNVFAGIALDLEKPFARRDWLRLDDGTPAQVIDMSWRATRLRTNEGLEIHQPNSEVAAARLVSYGSGVRPVALSFEVGLPYETPPAEAKAALAAAARQAPGALDSPGPQVFLHQFADHAVVYRMRVWTRGVHELSRFRDAVQTRIWYGLKREGIAIPFPIRTVHLHEAAREAETLADGTREQARLLLAGLDLFDQLPGEALDSLAASARRVHFDDGEMLVSEGEAGDSLFVLEAGRVLVSKQGGDGGSAVPLAHLARGAFFGEMSLLTGAPRSATVTAQGGVTVLVLSQPALAPLVEADPEIAETLSRAVTTRRADTEATLETRAKSRDPHPAATDESSILDRIRAFFKLP